MTASTIPRIIWFAGAIIAIIAGTVFFNTQIRTAGSEQESRKSGAKPAPIEVAHVQRGPLSLMRTFSGTIEPHAQFTIAPKVSGRIRQLHVDVSDTVVLGQLVVEMEDAEFEQEVIEAEAQLSVAEANQVEAVSRLEISQRELNRTRTLYNRGIASESDFDVAQASFLTSQATVKVAAANLKREQAMLRAARIRLGYTQVKAEWQRGDNERTVAERFFDEGNTVPANTPILSIVEIDPVIAVIQVTEKDYPLIKLGQQAMVKTDAFPDQTFPGIVTRISPVFRETSRQARLELEVSNPDHLLKPGMFSRCTLELQREEDAISVPQMAITQRSNEIGVFMVAEDGTRVKWVPVKLGFKSGDFIQVQEPRLSGRVVTLGQQFIKDGSNVRVAGEMISTPGGSESQ
jgi:RND family efflux transporter MFP subunit